MQVVQRRPWDNFLGTCKTEKTRKEYSQYLRLFLIHYKIGPDLEKLSVLDSIEIMKTSCEEILKQSVEQVEDLVIGYIEFMKKRKLAPDSINGRVAGIKKFLKANRFRLDWEHIGEFRPDAQRNHEDEAYTIDQIEKMLEYCSDIRIKCIILMFASMGIRLGSFETIQLKHMKPHDTVKGMLYEFTIYPGSNEQYVTFCSPECRKALDEYLDYRKRAGEELAKESYLIRKQFDRNDLQQVKNDCQPVKTTTIGSLVHNILVKSGIRQVNTSGKNKGFRHGTQMDHGFRKWYTSQCINANLNDTKRYLLEGHALPFNDPNYARVKQELLNEYLKVVDLLTVDQKFVLEKQVQELTEEADQIEVLKKQVSELQKFRIKTLKGEVRAYEDMITHMNKDPNDVVIYEEKLRFMQDEKKKVEKEIAELE